MYIIMKLLRLTTDSSVGIFESSLNQELIVGKQSQIALGSAALELEDTPLEITPANNQIEYQVLNGFEREVRLTPRIYNSSNAQEFFDDITKKLNEGIGEIAGEPLGGRAAEELGSAVEIGVQYQLQKNDKGFVEVQSKRSISAYNAQDLLNNSVVQQFGVPGDAARKDVVLTTTSGGSARYSTLGRATEMLAGQDFKGTTCQTYPMTKGCGIHRARIKTLRRPATNNFNTNPVGAGFCISVHEVSPLVYQHQRAMTLTDIKYGIFCDSRFLDVAGAGAGSGGGLPDMANSVYRAIVDGVIIEPPATTALGRIIPQQGVQNLTPNAMDTVAIEILSGTIRGVVYQNGGANGYPAVRILFSQPYDSATDLFGSYTFFGGGAQRRDAGAGGGLSGDFGCRLCQIRYTSDPYQQAKGQALQRGDGALSLESFAHVDDDPLLGASTPLPQSRTSSIHRIEFTTQEIASWLGFSRRTIEENASEPIFTGDKIFISHIENDCFLLEMLNIPVDSYDFLEAKKKRVNLLSVIPFDDNSGKVIYDPNHLIFLDINNQEELRLRDIRCRLVRSDYSEVALQGLSSLVLYIKDKGENTSSA